MMMATGFSFILNYFIVDAMNINYIEQANNGWPK